MAVSEPPSLVFPVSAPKLRPPSHLHTVTAIALREMRGRFGRRKLGYVWSFIEPAMYGSIVLMWFLLSGGFTPVDMSPLLFVLTGFAPWFYFYRMDQFVRFAYARNIPVLYHSHVSLLHLLIGRWILEAPTGAFFILIIFLSYSMIKGDPQAWPVDWSAIAIALSLDAFMALGYAAVLATILLRYEGLGWTLGFGVRAMFMTSGLNFVPDYAPEQWRNIIFRNPMTHIIIEFRRGFLPDYPSHSLDLPFVIYLILGLLALGLVLERYAARYWLKHTS